MSGVDETATSDRRWRPSPAAVASVIGTLGLSVMVVSLLVWGSRGFERLPASFFGTPLGQLPQLVTATCYILVGALLSVRVPRNPVGWLFLAIGLVWTVFLPANLVIAQAYEAFRPAPSSISVIAWLLSSFATAMMIGLIALAGLVFPDGRLVSRRWRAVVWLTIMSVVVFGLSVGLDPAGLEVYPSLPNPFAAPAALEPVFPVLRVARLIIVAPLLAVCVSLGFRYRGGDTVVRAQLRWITYAAVLQFAAFVPFILATYVIRASDPVGEALAAVTQIVGVAVPLAAAIAITRYHLFDIDVLIGRTLVYVPLMGALGGLYALAVAVFQRLFVALTGGTSELALLVALFLIAAAFTPLRKALESAVDRWAQPGRPSLRAPEAAHEEASDAELQRMAAALVSLQRLEARLTSAPRDGDDGTSHTLAIDADGLVNCPRGQRVPFSTCLGCSRLRGITTDPPQVTCISPSPDGVVP